MKANALSADEMKSQSVDILDVDIEQFRINNFVKLLGDDLNDNLQQLKASKPADLLANADISRFDKSKRNNNNRQKGQRRDAQKGNFRKQRQQSNRPHGNNNTPKQAATDTNKN